MKGKDKKTKEKEVEVKPSDVTAFINAKKEDTLIPEEDGVKLSKILEERSDELIVEKEDTVKLEVPAEPMFSPDRETHSSIMEWAQLQSPIEDLELTEDERMEFIRAALHDETLILQINLLSDVLVGCRALSDYEIDVMYAALDEDRQEGLIITDVDFFSRMQAYGVCMQVISVTAKPVDFITLKPKVPGVLGELESKQKDIARLRKHTSSAHLSPARAILFKTALRMFAAKMKLAIENIANADFWTPAVAD